MQNSKKIKLPEVTLVAMACVNVKKTIKAIQYSMREIDFAEAVLITHRKPFGLPDNINYKHTDKNRNIDDFNYKMVYELYRYIDTEFALVIHADGFVVNPQMWQREFLNYDYIGAPWPIPPENDTISFRDIDGNLCRVGNSVSIRSKRLMELPSKLKLPWRPYHGWYNEDGFICVNNRHVFEEHGMKFAPIEVAVQFSQETMIPEAEGIRPFAFHKWMGRNAEYPKF